MDITSAPAHAQRLTAPVYTATIPAHAFGYDIHCSDFGGDGIAYAFVGSNDEHYAWSEDEAWTILSMLAAQYAHTTLSMDLRSRPLA